MENIFTERKAQSQDRSVIQPIALQDFIAICDEYRVVEKATRKLLEIADDSNSLLKQRIDIYKWIIEMNIGKVKERSDLKTNVYNQGMSAGIFIEN